MLRYHDEEWGVPSHDERHLFEMLVLEGAQAGLSWITILRKREGYREAFAGFDPEPVARLTARDVERLMKDTGIVRNRMKIEATVAKLGKRMAAGPKDQFFNPFLQKSVDALAPTSVPVAHPLGGCRMAKNAADGVVDEFGRVFDASKADAFYDGLYVADAAIVPTALGVNPSLTISALALRIADNIIKEIDTHA